MSNDKTEWAIVGTGVVVLIAAILGLGWAVTHGILELGHYAFKDNGWTWDPTWYQSLFIMFVMNFLRPTKTVVKES